MNGRRPNLLRADAIMNMCLPTNILTLQSFLGQANYYQQLVPNIVKLRKPSGDLLKEVKRNWSVKCQNAFEDIKKY